MKATSTRAGHTRQPAIWLSLASSRLRTNQFERDWKWALKDNNIPYFKAQWFDKRKEFFKDEKVWDSQRRKGFMSRLLSVIEGSKATPIAFAIPTKDYEEIIPPGRVRNTVGTAYTLCGQVCIANAGTWAREQGHTKPVKYVFDVGHKNRGEFELAHSDEFQKPFAREKFLLGGLYFEDEQGFPPLQAADLVAFEFAQFLAGRTQRYPLRKLIGDGSSVDRKFDRKALIEIRNKHCPKDPWTE